MSLLLQDDAEDFEALDAALSFVDAYIASPETAAAQNGGTSSSDDAMLGDELDELLRATLSSGGQRQITLPPPMGPLSANMSDSDVVKVRGNGRLRGGCRLSLCQASTGDNPKKRVKVNPNRARNERKNELAYLRNKVAQMETELGELHTRHHMGSSSTLLVENGSSSLSSAPPPGPNESAQALSACNSALDIPPFWRDMATRQKLRREKAERENARLKLVLEGQIKLARSLETLLQKRARQQVSDCADQEGVNGTQGRTLDFLADKRTFDALLTSVDDAYCEVDEVLVANGLADSETPSRDACMREGVSGMYLDISSNKVLPFGQDAVGAAVWDHFKGTDKHRGNLYEKAAKKLDTTDDTVMEDFKMEFMGKTTREDFRVRQVLRRYLEADRQVVVWVTSVHSLDESKPRPFAGLGFAEKGYVVIKQPKSPALVKGGFTMLQMCSIVVPQKAASCVQDTTTVGAFTEFVLNVIVANATVSQERIENVLLDQALKEPPCA